MKLLKVDSEDHVHFVSSPDPGVVRVSASHRGCSPPFCLAAENKQSSNQQRTFPPETSRHPSRAPHGPQQSLFTVCLW